MYVMSGSRIRYTHYTTKVYKQCTMGHFQIILQKMVINICNSQIEFNLLKIRKDSNSDYLFTVYDVIFKRKIIHPFNMNLFY